MIQDLIAPYIGMNFLPILLYAFFGIPALLALRKRHLDDTARAAWVVGILIAPLMAAIAFVLIQPGSDQPMRP